LKGIYILILGNTIRLFIENRKEEIAVVKLVGGTNAFVRRPFLYMGVFFGFGGARVLGPTIGAGTGPGPRARVAVHLPNL
jgi:cell division protein FtsX